MFTIIKLSLNQNKCLYFELKILQRNNLFYESWHSSFLPLLFWRSNDKPSRCTRRLSDLTGRIQGEKVSERERERKREGETEREREGDRERERESFYALSRSSVIRHFALSTPTGWKKPDFERQTNLLWKNVNFFIWVSSQKNYIFFVTLKTKEKIFHEDKHMKMYF